MIKEQFLPEFKKFQELREVITDPVSVKDALYTVGEPLDEYPVMPEKFLDYNGAYILFQDGGYYCMVGRDDIFSKNLLEVEEFLFTKHYVSEYLMLEY